MPLSPVVIDNNTDVALGMMLDEFFHAVNDDILVQKRIKRLFYEKLYERGGDRNGARKKIIGKLLEAAQQHKNNEPVILEIAQYDDDKYYTMGAKAVEVEYVMAPLIQQVGPGLDTTSESKMSWACGPILNEEGTPNEDELYVKPVATDYTGTDKKSDTYDGPPVPVPKKYEDRYDTDKYTPEQHNAAIKEVKDFALKTSKMSEIGCCNNLDQNSLACRKTRTNLELVLTDLRFKLRADIYSGKIRTFMCKRAMLNKHHVLCRCGDIRDHITLNDNAVGSLTLETLRILTLMAKGQTDFGPMLAIEAAMAQRLFIDGLNLYTIQRGILVKEYLSSTEINAFDLSKNMYGLIRHWPYYPITKKNMKQYHKSL